MVSPFKIGFNIEDYLDILPKFPDNDDEILNMDKDLKDQYWVKCPFPNVIDRDFIMQEAIRLKQGVWILIKGMPIWIPPNYYQFLQYGKAGSNAPEFRLKRLKTIYTKIKVRKDPRFIGTYNIKNRQDGDTTINMNDALWEVISGDLNDGMIGIQSKTRADAQNPCWFTLQSHWNAYPKFFKDNFYPHFISGNNIAEKLQFMQAADPNDPNDLGKNVVIQYGPAVYNAFDGKNNMRRCILDEINKWVEASFWDTYSNYLKFIMPGRQRKGLFDIFSSPSDTNGRHNDEAYQFWQDSNPDDIQVTGSTKSRVLRSYANPLDGIEGFYDEYGDADPQEILEHIKRERANKPKDKLMGEIRGYPLPIIGTNRANEDELFGSSDTHAIFINIQGIKERRNIILGKKRELVTYGNYQWPQNIPDSGIPIFVPTDRMNFDDHDARFCITDINSPVIQLEDLKTPPLHCEEVLGIDPFNLRYQTKNVVTGSLAAMIAWKFRDILQTGKKDYPTLLYLNRPTHAEIMYEDAIKAAVARCARVQYENTNDKLENYFEDRGYIKWMIDSINAKPVEINGEYKVRKGDAPSGRGATAFLNEGIGLINGVTNKPLIPDHPDHPYLLDWWNFEEALEDLVMFVSGNTQKSHITMAIMQALLGKVKLLYQKVRKKLPLNNEILHNYST